MDRCEERAPLANADAVRDLLDRHDLQGPYAYDADVKTFRHHNTKIRVDPIFVSRLARPELVAQGFSLP